MNRSLVRPRAASLEARAGLSEEAESATAYAAASRSEATTRAYRQSWEAFASWCREHGRESLPAEPKTLALYLASLADEGLSAATIDRSLAAISKAHDLAGHTSPRGHRVVREVRAGIRRTHGTAQRRKAPISVETIRRIVTALPSGLLGARDRALLLVGFASACRRSELVALDVADVRFLPEGVELTIRRSKTDQEGAGRKVAIPYGKREDTCPVRALRAWLDASGIQGGAIFRSVKGATFGPRLGDRSVALAVKRWAQLAGLDPKDFAGHSLRAGLATQAARAGKSDREIMRQTGHRSREMIDRYVRDGEIFVKNAAKGIGL